MSFRRSLQLKVRRLEVERERSLKVEEGADLEEEDRKDGGAEAGEERLSPAKSVSGRSFNESNSTTNQKCENRETGGEDARPKPEPDEPLLNSVETKPVQTGSKPIGDLSSVARGDDDASSQDLMTVPRAAEAARGLAESNELSESAAESKREGKEGGATTKQNSEAHVRGRTKRRRRAGVPVASSSGGEEPEAEVSPATKSSTTVKSQPLVRLLGIIRSHKLGSAFERRLRSQVFLILI